MEDMSKVCDRFQQFCANSAKPLLYSGGFVTLISAVALGYVAHTSNVLYASVVKDAADLALNYYLQLAASVYLLLASILVYLAAYYDQKHIVRVLAILTTINVVLVLISTQMIPANQDLIKRFENILLNNGIGRYEFPNGPQASNDTSNAARTKREASNNEVWDYLHSYGCCGLNNATKEWSGKAPPSCCTPQVTDTKTKETAPGNQDSCTKPDSEHERPCSEVIKLTSLRLIAVLCLIGLNNLYLAIVTIIIAYRTLHYSEASQNAYN